MGQNQTGDLGIKKTNARPLDRGHRLGQKPLFVQDEVSFQRRLGHRWKVYRHVDRPTEYVTVTDVTVAHTDVDAAIGFTDNWKFEVSSRHLFNHGVWKDPLSTKPLKKLRKKTTGNFFGWLWVKKSSACQVSILADFWILNEPFSLLGWKLVQWLTDEIYFFKWANPSFYFTIFWYIIIK